MKSLRSQYGCTNVDYRHFVITTSINPLLSHQMKNILHLPIVSNLDIRMVFRPFCLHHRYFLVSKGHLSLHKLVNSLMLRFMDFWDQMSTRSYSAVKARWVTPSKAHKETQTITKQIPALFPSQGKFTKLQLRKTLLPHNPTFRVLNATVTALQWLKWIYIIWSILTK